MGHLVYLMFRCDFDVMESLEEFGGSEHNQRLGESVVLCTTTGDILSAGGSAEGPGRSRGLRRDWGRCHGGTRRVRGPRAGGEGCGGVFGSRRREVRGSTEEPRRLGTRSPQAAGGSTEDPGHAPTRPTAANSGRSEGCGRVEEASGERCGGSPAPAHRHPGSKGRGAMAAIRRGGRDRDWEAPRQWGTRVRIAGCLGLGRLRKCGAEYTAELPMRGRAGGPGTRRTRHVGP